MIPSSSDGRTKESVEEVKSRFFFWKIRQLKLKKSVIRRTGNWMCWVGAEEKLWILCRNEQKAQAAHLTLLPMCKEHRRNLVILQHVSRKSVQPQWKLPQSEISFYWNTIWNRMKILKSSFVEIVFCCNLWF